MGGIWRRNGVMSDKYMSDTAFPFFGAIFSLATSTTGRDRRQAACKPPIVIGPLGYYLVTCTPKRLGGVHFEGWIVHARQRPLQVAAGI